MWPGAIFADPVMLPAPVISAVQTGSTTSATEEYIELRNSTTEVLDLSGYQLQLAHSGVVDWATPHRTIQLTGSLQPGATITVASKYMVGGVEIKYQADTATAWFGAGIAAAGGGARLVYNADRLQTDGSCAPKTIMVDEVSWTNMPSGPSTQLPHTTIDPIVASAGLGPSDCVPIPPTTGPPASQPEAPIPTVPAPILPPADVGLLAPQISELLPNPAAPLTDAADEYIELYNPNSTIFDLTGFTLKTGLNGTYSYVFPANTLLPAAGFSSFLAKDTKLVLSNGGGKAVLLDPFGTVIAQTDPYGKAAAGQAWIAAGNTWQWSAQPSSGAVNVVAQPVTDEPKAPVAKTAKTTKTAVAAKKTTVPKTARQSVKSAKTTKVKIKEVVLPEPKTQTLAAASKPEASPLHSGVLATAAILAVLYGAYEYRHDVANKIQQLRANRANRAALRQSTKGR